MRLTVTGSSDAFGSGGRLQTCFHVAHAKGQFLIDCGATSLIGLARAGIDPNAISAIFISHLHGDHFSGLVWWLIHANHVAKRKTPLVIAGPEGIEQRFNAAAEALFPGATSTPRGFEWRFVAYREATPLLEAGVEVTPFEVVHPSGAPPYALRFRVDGKTLAFSGDTEWVETLVPVSAGADLFICECTGYEREARSHLNWATIRSNLPRLTAKKLLLTHLGPDMLANAGAIRDPRVLVSTDGLVVDV